MQYVEIYKNNLRGVVEMRKFAHSCLITVLAVISLALFSSCFALPIEPAAFEPPTFNPPPPREFRTVYAGRGDVRHMATVWAMYTFVREEIISFDVNWLPIEAFHVEFGDIVGVGDLLVSAGVPGLDEEREEIERVLDGIHFRLRQANERHQTMLNVAEATGNPVDDSRVVMEIENIIDELEIANFQLAQLGEVFHGANLVSPVYGIVTHVAAFREGMMSTAGARLVAISELGVTAFLVNAPMAMAHMNFGDFYSIRVGETVVPLMVVDPEEHGFGGRPEWVNARFLIPTIPVDFDVGTTFAVEVVVEEAFDVVYLPHDVVREVDGRTFVYVLEDGLRQLREVVVGVRGNDTEEIISGLEEGDEVIL